MDNQARTPWLDQGGDSMTTRGRCLDRDDPLIGRREESPIFAARRQGRVRIAGSNWPVVTSANRAKHRTGKRAHENSPKVVSREEKFWKWFSRGWSAGIVLVGGSVKRRKVKISTVTPDTTEIAPSHCGSEPARFCGLDRVYSQTFRMRRIGRNSAPSSGLTLIEQEPINPHRVSGRNPFIDRLAVALAVSVKKCP